MKSIVLFDPSQGTLNLGDNIINDAIMSELSPVFDGNYLTRLSTHTPILHSYQLWPATPYRDICQKADLKLLGGTNLIKTNLLARRPDWNVNMLTAGLYRGSIAMGCGTGGAGGIKNSYTRTIYRTIFSSSHIHSCRDQRSVDILQSIGLKAINTGCPTMWSLTPDHCAHIPTGRASRAIFTVTDYAKDPTRDLAVLKILRDNYEHVSVWVQGSRDFSYLQELDILDQVTVIPPSLDAYRDALAAGDVDYVGTRLHAGIFAMRHGRKAIIVAVDARAMDIQRTFNINAVPREDLNQLTSLINGDMSTDVRIDTAAIEEWKSQF